MIEARFDDLTGEAPSFRLTDPAGVLEAMRPEDVAPDARRPPRARPRAACGSPGSSRTRPRPAWIPRSSFDRARRTTRSPGSRSPGSRCSSSVRRPCCRRPATTRLRRPTPGCRPSTASATTGAIERIREHIAAGDTYQVNHTLRLRSTRAGRRARPLPRPLLRATRRARRLPERRALPDPLAPRRSCSSVWTATRSPRAR